MPAADLVQAVADRFRGDLPRPPSRLQRLEPTSEKRRQRRRVSATGTVRGAVGMALAGNLDQPLAIEEEVDQILAVAAGDDDGLRSQLEHAAGEILLAFPLPHPRHPPRPRNVGSDNGAS